MIVPTSFLARQFMRFFLRFRCVSAILIEYVHILLQIGAESDAEKRQLCCGCSTKRTGVPLSAKVVVLLDKEATPLSYELELRVLPYINGVVTISEAGLVHSFNANFLAELTGRTAYDAPLLITDIVANFWDAPAFSSYVAGKCLVMFAHSIYCPLLDQTTYVTSNGTIVSANEATTSSSTIGETVDFFDTTPNGDEPATIPKRCNSVPAMQCGSFYGLVQHVGGLHVPVRFDVTRIDAPRVDSTAADISTPQRLYAVALGYERGIDYNFVHIDVAAENAAAAAAAASAAETPTDERANSLAASLDERLADVEPRSGPQTNGAITVAATALLNSAAAMPRSASGTNVNAAADDLDARMKQVKLSALDNDSNEAVRGDYAK